MSSAATQMMDLEVIIVYEVSLTEKDKYHLISLICGIFKQIQLNLFTKQKQTHRHRKQTYGHQRGKGEKGKLGAWS